MYISGCLNILTYTFMQFVNDLNEIRSRSFRVWISLRMPTVIFDEWDLKAGEKNSHANHLGNPFSTSRIDNVVKYTWKWNWLGSARNNSNLFVAGHY